MNYGLIIAPRPTSKTILDTTVLSLSKKQPQVVSTQAAASQFFPGNSKATKSNSFTNSSFGTDEAKERFITSKDEAFLSSLVAPEAFPPEFVTVYKYSTEKEFALIVVFLAKKISHLFVKYLIEKNRGPVSGHLRFIKKPTNFPNLKHIKAFQRELEKTIHIFFLSQSNALILTSNYLIDNNNLKTAWKTVFPERCMLDYIPMYSYLKIKDCRTAISIVWTTNTHEQHHTEKTCIAKELKKLLTPEQVPIKT